MNCSTDFSFRPAEMIRLLASNRKRWIVPAVAIAGAAIVFAAVRPATWQASQALIIRNEASGNHEGPGKFSHADQMKTLQETILEVTLSRSVLEAALVEVGPPADYRNAPEAWPSPRDVADLRDAVALKPPKGAEFGETEVFYLTVKDHDRARALALAAAVCDQLDRRSQELRDAQAKSMIRELVDTVQLAKTDLDESTGQLSQIEREAGSDLAELRILNDATTGDSALRRTEADIRTELRQARATHQSNAELLSLLKSAKDDPGQLLAAPNRLLESQPSLRRLKDGLVDAQLETATLQGRMSDAHPAVQAARESQREIGRHLHNELPIALRGIEVELRLDADRIAMLEGQLADATGRMQRLAQMRASYANLVAQTRHRSQLVDEAEQNLAQARASQAGADAASLIARIDAPDAGTNPLGTGRATIALLGVIGGLAVGLGIVVLTVSPNPAVSSDTTASLEAREDRVADARRVPTHADQARPVFCAAPSLSLTDALRRLSESQPTSRN